MTSTVVAIDIDGVLNSFSKTSSNLVRVNVGEYRISFRVPVLKRLFCLLVRSDVDVVWLTTWLSEPELLDEFEDALRTVIPESADIEFQRATYPQVVQRPAGGAPSVSDERFPEPTQPEPGSPNWWKYPSARMLLTDGVDRLAWLDDDFRSVRTLPGIDPRDDRHLLLRTHSVAGILDEDVDRLSAWIKRDFSLT